MKNAKEMQEMMLTESVGPLVLKLAGPTIVTMLVTSFYSLVDTFFVAQLGVIESSAVGIVFSVMTVIQALGFFFGQGAANTISPLLGKGEVKRANEVFATAFFTAIAVLSSLALISLILIKPLVIFLGATDETLQASIEYGRIIVIGSPWLGTCYTMNNIFRSEGKALLGMLGMSLGGILNIFLDALFIFGFGWGVQGAAFATVLSQAISFVVLISFFEFKKSNLTLSIKNIRFEKKIYKSVFSLGAPSLFRNLGSTVCNIAMMHVAALYVAAATAAMSIVGRIVHFVLSLCIGFGQGMQPVVGYNWGADRRDRVKSAYNFSLKLGTIVFIFLACFVAFGNKGIMRAFIDDETAVEIGSRALFFQALVMPFLVSVILEGMLMQCSGHGKEASIMALLRQGLIYIPCLLILNATLGLFGLELAQTVSDFICFIATLYMTRRVRNREGF